MKKVAVFDVDGTIFRSSLLIELVKGLVNVGLFPADAYHEYDKEFKAWLDRTGGYDAYIDKVVETFRRHLKGVHYSAFEDISKRVIDEHKNRVYRYTRDLLKELKQEDYFLLAVSQSPKIILDAFCKHIGFDKVYGRMYEVGPSDRFTGVVMDEHLIANKANIVHRAVEKEGLTLKGSVGVGDTEGDISFLEIVERPICFNPNSILYKHAKINDWKVVVERKDVVYEL